MRRRDGMQNIGKKRMNKKIMSIGHTKIILEEAKNLSYIQ